MKKFEYNQHNHFLYLIIGPGFSFANPTVLIHHEGNQEIPPCL